MRILFVISSLRVGGEQQAATIITNQFIKLGHDVAILSLLPKAPKSFAFNGNIQVKFTDSDKSSNRHLKRMRSILDTSREYKPDVILAFAAIPSIYCSVLKRRLRVPVVITERNDPAAYSKLIKCIRRLVYPLSDYAVFQTNDASDCFQFIPDSKKIVISNPVDSDWMTPEAIASRRKAIVNISRFVDSKRQGDLVEAFVSIAPLIPDFRLEFYGDGPTKERVIEIAKNTECSNRILFFEALPNVWDRIKNASVFVLCSDHEGMPNSLIEALFLGVPSVATDCRIGGPKELIDNGINGILVPVGDKGSLADAILRIARDEQFAKELSMGSMRKMQGFAPRTIAEKWLRVFSQLCKEHHEAVD